MEEEIYSGLFDRMIEDCVFDYNEKKSKIIISKCKKIINESIQSECLLKELNQCNGSIIDAHSIQNSRILEKLSENNEVVYIDKNRVSINKNLVPKKIATTFRGFCAYHDKEIFKPIEEKEYELGDIEQNFLFTYRAFAKEYIDTLGVSKFYNDYYIDKLINNNELNAILEKHTSENLPDKEKIRAKKNAVLLRQDKRVEELEKQMKELEKLKNCMNYYLTKKMYSKIDTISIEIPVENKIACCCSIYIHLDTEGKEFNRTYDNPMFLNIFPQGNKTIILLSYLNKHRYCFSNFINQIKKFENKEILISNILLKYGNNIVFNPSYLKQFGESQLNIVERALNRNTQFRGEKLCSYSINLFRIN